MQNTETSRSDGTSRRALLGFAAAAGITAGTAKLFGREFGASAASAATLRPAATAPSDPFPGIPGENQDIKVLNFALTLEFLERNLYRQALNKASGRGLSTPLDQRNGPKAYQLKIGAGGLSADAAADGFAYLKHFAFVEDAHVNLLLGVIPQLGGTPTSANPAGYQFPGGIGADLKAILTQILPLEETGVRAYLGAATYLSSLALVQAAGEIYSTEARHSAVVAYTLGIDPGPRHMAGDLSVVPNPPAANTFEYYLAPSTVISKAMVYFL